MSAPPTSLDAQGELDALVGLDLQSLFVHYDRLYFGGTLQRKGNVVVEWSSGRMTRCAGTCSYRGVVGVSALCTVRLSEPVLKWRSSADIKNTLLHEMIHALLFVTNGNVDHDGHGGPFLQMMCDINDSEVFDAERPREGYNISVYHEFTDEVKQNQNHVWRCKGCGKVIRRAMNRPPSIKDCVIYRRDGSKGHDRCGLSFCGHHKHARSCGGEFDKIAEPPSKKRKGTPSEGDPGKARKGNAPSQSSIPALFGPSLSASRPPPLDARPQPTVIVLDSPQKTRGSPAQGQPPRTPEVIDLT